MMMLCLFFLAAARTHSLTNVTSDSTGICLCTLSSCRKMASVAVAAICLDVFETFDIAGNFALEISFYLEALDDLPDGIFLVDCEIFWLCGDIYLCLLEYKMCTRTSDAINSRESNLNSFLFWKCNTEDTHENIKLALTLLVTRVGLADHIYIAPATNDGALWTYTFDCCFDPHVDVGSAYIIIIDAIFINDL